MRYQFKQIDKLQQTLQKQRELLVLLALLCIICTSVTSPPIVIQAQVWMNHHSTGKTIAKDIYIDGQTSYTKRYTVSTSSKTSHVDGQVQQSDPQTTRTHLHSKFVVPKSMIATVTENSHATRHRLTNRYCPRAGHCLLGH